MGRMASPTNGAMAGDATAKKLGGTTNSSMNMASTMAGT